MPDFYDQGDKYDAQRIDARERARAEAETAARWYTLNLLCAGCRQPFAPESLDGLPICTCDDPQLIGVDAIVRDLQTGRDTYRDRCARLEGDVTWQRERAERAELAYAALKAQTAATALQASALLEKVAGILSPNTGDTVPPQRTADLADALRSIGEDH